MWEVSERRQKLRRETVVCRVCFCIPPIGTSQVRSGGGAGSARRLRRNTETPSKCSQRRIDRHLQPLTVRTGRKEKVQGTVSNLIFFFH